MEHETCCTGECTTTPFEVELGDIATGRAEDCEQEYQLTISSPLDDEVWLRCRVKNPNIEQLNKFVERIKAAWHLLPVE